MWLRNFTETLSFVLVLSSLVAGEAIPDCQVMATKPTTKTFAPISSSVIINCELTSTTQTNDAFWAIDLSGVASNYQYRFTPSNHETSILNDHGVYELPPIETPGMPPTLRLLINDTASNNGTKILCSTGQSTTLFVFESTPFVLEVLDVNENAIIISWSQNSRSITVSDAVQTFSLTVNHGSSSQVISLNDSFYNFTAPEDAPPCEVYNFSVTATYVGATYTGAGCSVPSPVLSTMLPSLPDLGRLESSLHYSLVKDSEDLTLNVSFEAANYCGYHPVLNYSLEVQGPSSDMFCQSVSPGVENIIHNLTENSNYSFIVLVNNSVGVVSTNSKYIFTTDVQNVTATPVETMNAFVVQCVFITGSNAQGCMVVLVGELENITANLEQNGSKVLNVSHPLSCYHEIFAFDIESDGSVGTLAVPGVLVGSKGVTSCLTSVSDGLNVVAIIGCGIAIVMIIALIIMAVVIIIYKVKRSKTLARPSNVYPNELEPDKNCSELNNVQNTS